MENKYVVYRKIRHDRTYRTLGKMGPLRVILGIALLILVLLISGTVSQYFASHGKFRTAQALMIAPGWMEQYKPEVKAYIEAGVLYQQGDYAQAYDAFGDIAGVDAAAAMKSVCAVSLAQEELQKEAYDEAYDIIVAVDAAVLPEESEADHRDICSRLFAYYSETPGDVAQTRAQKLFSMLNALSGNV